MKSETAGITRANEGLDGIVWNILGQTYVPKHLTEHSFSWHATFPPDTFVPPHIHPTQDEYLYILEGRLDFWLDGQDTHRQSRRPRPPADGKAARHLQQVGRDGEVPVLGLADGQALRPVLGHPQHVAADARGGRRAVGEARRRASCRRRRKRPSTLPFKGRGRLGA